MRKIRIKKRLTKKIIIKKQTQNLHKYWMALFGFFVAIASLSFFTNQNRTYDNSCANSKSCIVNLSGAYESQTNGIFMGKKVSSPLLVEKTVSGENVLGENTGSNKHIYIDLSRQYLEAKEGERVVFGFQISSGKWYPTPTGDFRIWIKLRYTRMEGGNPAINTYYNLPNVPYTMYFYNDQIPKTRGFGLHGAYWHSNFGHPMSHGCINISVENSELLYNWADPPATGGSTYASDEHPGTQLTIFGEAPKE